MIVGTCYFPTMYSAERYYADYGCTPANVRRMIAEGEIHIGTPPHNPGDRVELIDGGRRWAIVEAA